MNAQTTPIESLREQLKPIFWDVYDPDSDTEGNVQAALDRAMPIIAGLLVDAPTEEPTRGDCRGYCEHDGEACNKAVGREYVCTRPVGHDGPCVACSFDDHDLTGALRAAGVAPQEPSGCSDDGCLHYDHSPDREKLIAEAEKYAAFDGELGFKRVKSLLSEMAALSRAAAPEPEWEYGINMAEGWIAPVVLSSLDEAREDSRKWSMTATVVRRRKAGPWEPVPREKGESSG